jgi:hypothetical protein
MGEQPSVVRGRFVASTRCLNSSVGVQILRVNPFPTRSFRIERRFHGYLTCWDVRRYVSIYLNFTISHEGDTPFMYNNWSAKNPLPDVTIGVGRALTSLPKIGLGPGQFTCLAGEREAASVRVCFVC